MKDDVVHNKVATIERCLARIRSAVGRDPQPLEDQDAEDVVVLNLMRAGQASIDLAMHVVARERLGLPQESRGAFELLVEHGWIDRRILLAIVRERLTDFEAFCGAPMRRESTP